MPIHFSRVMAAQARGSGSPFSTKSLDLTELSEQASPVLVLDDFRVTGRPFGPHPHAGFSAITYVLEDSQGSLRNRDSLGNDVVLGPGGIIWLQAGSGAIHEETPQDRSHELHGLQIFVNTRSQNKLAPPKVLRLATGEVPEWRGDAGDRARVVVGSFGGVSSPLVPAEPFSLLDVELCREISFEVPNSHNALVYVLMGSVTLRVDGREQRLTAQHAVALYGGAGRVTVEASQPGRFIVLSGAEIREPVLAQGPFIMSDRSQLEAAFDRFRKGEMGHLAPRAD
jgi:redox-sensitive bicupin YhaK (pirin superfamily)